MTDTYPITFPEPQATFWRALPQAPVLLYHRCPAQTGTSSDYDIQLADFERHLAVLDKAGFSLVTLEDWLAGRINVPPNRRPLILTVADLFHPDQISLDSSGIPKPQTGIGCLWRLAQSHPDFGFAAALFYKAAGTESDRTNLSLEAALNRHRQGRAKTAAWCLRHGATPPDHFLSHPSPEKPKSRMAISRAVS